MTKLSRRTTYFFGFIAVVALLLGSFYLEIYRGVTPCLLCILQRLVLGILGIFFFLGALFSRLRYTRWIIDPLNIFTALLGATIAARQIWLQHFPLPNGETCEASLQYMFSVLPIDEVIKKMLAGSATCSQVGWEFLHLSLAQWSFFCFIAFLFFSLWQCRKK